jgi:hypothetical protein
VKIPRYYYPAISFSALSLAALMLLPGALLFQADPTRIAPYAQRWFAFAMLVGPPIIGAGAGVVGLMTPGHQKALSALGLLLNVGFGLFLAAVLLLAG